MITVEPTGCCPPFDPQPYQETEWTWKDKPFVKDHVTSFLHIPLNMGRKVTKNMALIEAADALPEQQLMLSDEGSPWGSNLYINVSGEVPGAQMSTLSGTFLTRVYDGPFKDAVAWAENMKSWLEQRGEALEQLYFAYTTCPRCARAYGHNYVVLFARVHRDDAPVAEAR